MKKQIILPAILVLFACLFWIYGSAHADTSSEDPNKTVSWVWPEDVGYEIPYGYNVTATLDIGVHTITLKDIDKITIAISAPSSIEIPNLIGYWPMNDNGHNKYVVDNSDNNNNGLAQRNTSLLAASGVQGNALNFNGVNDYISLGSPAVLNDLPAKDFTVSVWIYEESSAGRGTVIGVSPDNDIGWMLRKYGVSSDGRISFLVRHSGSRALAYTDYGTVPKDAWTHVAAVWDASTKTVQIYINGAESSYLIYETGSGNYISDASYDKEIGRISSNRGEQYFGGNIDELKIFNRKLTLKEIEILYGTGATSGGTTGNISPVADSGPDQTLTDTDDNGNEIVTLDGSGSTDQDGMIASYIWSENGSQIATGVSANITLSTGNHNITLMVTDDQGATDTDDITISISPASSGVNIEGLLAHWSMDDNGANKQVSDSGDNNIDGISQRNTSVLSSTGVIGSALNFDGADDFVNLGSPAVLNDLPAKDFTVSVWIYEESSAGRGTVIGVSPDNDIGWMLRKYGVSSDGRISFLVRHSGSRALAYTDYGTVPKDAWTHVAAVWDASTKTVQIYINGAESSYVVYETGSGNYISDASYDKEIGRISSNDGTQYFGGNLDELKIFNRKLTSQEIELLYNQ